MRGKKSSRTNGGYAFALDPQVTALSQPIFWSLEADPSDIVLNTSPIEASLVNAADLTGRSRTSLGLQFLDVRIHGERFAVHLRHQEEASPLAAIVLLDDLTPDRLAALTRFWAALQRRPIPPDPRLTLQRKERAKQMLRAVDARVTGANYRHIAQFLFPRHDHDAASWVGSAIRETTIRLARDGSKLVRGGYRLLLRQPRRSR